MPKLTIIALLAFSIVLPVSANADEFKKVSFETVRPRGNSGDQLSLSSTGELVTERESHLGRSKENAQVTPTELKEFGVLVKAIPADIADRKYGEDFIQIDGGTSYYVLVDNKRICCQISEFPASVSAVVDRLNTLAAKYFEKHK